MIDLDSNRIGTETDTDSEIWLRSSWDSKERVKIGSKMESKPKNWCLRTFPINEVWSEDISDSISHCTSSGFNVDSIIEKKI